MQMGILKTEDKWIHKIISRLAIYLAAEEEEKKEESSSLLTQFASSAYRVVGSRRNGSFFRSSAVSFQKKFHKKIALISRRREVIH